MGVYLTFLLTMSSRGGSGIGGSPRALVRACAIANAKEKEGKEGRRRDEWVSGGRKTGWPKRPVADRGRLWGKKRSFWWLPPSLIAHTIRTLDQVEKHKMSERKFNKAVAIIQSLPKDGPIRPSQEDQLFVRTPVFFFVS